MAVKTLPEARWPLRRNVPNAGHADNPQSQEKTPAINTHTPIPAVSYNARLQNHISLKGLMNPNWTDTLLGYVMLALAVALMASHIVIIGIGLYAIIVE